MICGQSVANYYFCQHVARFAPDGFKFVGSTLDQLTETALTLAFEGKVPKCLRMLRVTFTEHGGGMQKLQRWLDSGSESVCDYTGATRMIIGKSDEFTLADVCAIARELRDVLDLLAEEQKGFLHDGLMLMLSRMGN